MPKVFHRIRPAIGHQFERSGRRPGEEVQTPGMIGPWPNETTFPRCEAVRKQKPSMLLH